MNLLTQYKIIIAVYEIEIGFMKTRLHYVNMTYYLYKGNIILYIKQTYNYCSYMIVYRILS